MQPVPFSNLHFHSCPEMLFLMICLWNDLRFEVILNCGASAHNLWRPHPRKAEDRRTRIEIKSDRNHYICCICLLTTCGLYIKIHFLTLKSHVGAPRRKGVVVSIQVWDGPASSRICLETVMAGSWEMLLWQRIGWMIKSSPGVGGVGALGRMVSAAAQKSAELVQTMQV